MSKATAAWLKTTSYDLIRSWSAEECCAFLELSSTTQKTLSGGQNASVCRERVRDCLLDRIRGESKPPNIEEAYKVGIDVITQLSFVLNISIRDQYDLDYNPINYVSVDANVEEKLRLCSRQLEGWTKYIASQRLLQQQQQQQN